VLLCLTLNALLLAGIAVRRPDYLVDAQLNPNPDALHYVLLGRNLLTRGEFSRSDTAPYIPDALRTPAYPAFAGGLDLLGNAGAIYVVQILLHAASCALLFGIVRSGFGASPAFWASLLLAVDPLLITHNFVAMSENVFLFLMLAALGVVFPLFGQADLKMTAARLLAGGLLLGVATLTRPLSLYAGLLIAGALVVRGSAQRGFWRKGFAPGLAFGIFSLLLPAAWAARNYACFSVPRLTTVDANNLVYFVGAGAYQVHHGVSLEKAQDMIAEEYGLEPYIVVQNAHAAPRAVAEMDAELQAAKWKVLSKYPAELLIACFTSPIKATFSHGTSVLAFLIGDTWTAPGTGPLLALRTEAWEALASNSPILIIAFVIQLLLSVLALAAAFTGIVRGLRRPALRGLTILVALLAAYFYFTIALFGYDAFYRCRIPFVPFLYALAGLGLGARCKLGYGSRTSACVTRAAEGMPVQ